MIKLINRLLASLFMILQSGYLEFGVAFLSHDHSDRGASNELLNPLWVKIHRFFC